MSRMCCLDWRRFPLAFVVVFFFIAVTACVLMKPAPAPPKIHWQTLVRGRTLAAERHLPGLVDFFYGPGCQRCDRFINEIYTDHAVIARVNARFIPVRISLAAPLSPEEQMLADEMANMGECMLMFLDPGGEVIRRRQGPSICSTEPMGVAEFIAMLDDVERILTER